MTISKSDVVLSDRFQKVGEGGIDERKRISLAKTLEKLSRLFGEGDTIRFAIYVNDAGQVLLSPKVSVPAHELWLYRNPVALAKVEKGLADAAEGKVSDLGSFEKYADDEID